jgi:Superinfection immunity protein
MITLSVLALIYFLPTIVAVRQGHDVAPILLLNLFFGWTGIGWVAMLLWALLARPRYWAAVPPPPPIYYPYAGPRY